MKTIKKIILPNPVIGVRGCLNKQRLYLSWHESARAVAYQVYCADHEILLAKDLATAKLLREVPYTGCEIAWRRSKPAFCAVIAVDAHGQRSKLNPDEKSTVVIVPD